MLTVLDNIQDGVYGAFLLELRNSLKINKKAKAMGTSSRRTRRIGWCCGGVMLVLVLYALGGEAAEVQREVMAMGTRLVVTVTAEDSDDAWRATEAAIREVDEVESRLSTWREESDVSRVNRAEIGRWVVVSRKTAADLADATAFSRMTQGAFSPGIGATVERWLGHGVQGHPDGGEIVTLRMAADPGNLEIEGDRVRRLHALYRLDTGAFGKGVALQEAMKSGLEAGAICVDLNFGGQVMRGGRCGEILISIADPDDRWSSAAVSRLANGSVATSGNSERGKGRGYGRVGHIFDPRTGRPSTFRGSVTVKTGDPLAADVLSTALFVMGPEVGKIWLQSSSDLDVEALWISGEGEIVWVTPGFGIEIS